jgi:hypothetical protein
MMLNPWSAFPLVDISDAADVCPIRHTSIAAIHRDTEAYVLVCGIQRRGQSPKHDPLAPYFAFTVVSTLITCKGLCCMDALAGPTAVGLARA